MPNHPWPWYQIDPDGRVGKVAFTNDLGNSLGVILWFPDTGAALQTWYVGGGTTKTISFDCENDWGVQLGQGEIKQLARCGTFSASGWSLSATQFVNA
jgi:hypothetical protein